jgi:glycosyltransferase involved in cell wall biosynthesis
VQRVLQFVEFLGEEGWSPEVLTVKQGAYPNRDPALRDRIPASVPVHRTATINPHTIYRIATGKEETDLPTGGMPDTSRSWMETVATWIRANVFLPDARVGWWPFAVKRGRELLRTGRFDALLTSGAPQSVHLIGWTLQAWTGVHWVADLHDPWTDISYYDEIPHTTWARRLDEALERGVLSAASAVTTVSPSWKALFAQKASNQFFVVENGIQERQFDGIDVSLSPDQFVLAHVGNLYGGRNPKAVWAALAQLREEGALPNLSLRLVGSVDETVRQSLDEYGLMSIVERVEFVPHEEALCEMARSTLLLLVIEQFAEAEGMITSKLYEYLASERPVLGIGPPGGDADALLRAHDAGEIVAWSDASRATAVLRAHYEAWNEGRPIGGADRHALTAHSRRRQARRMAQVLTYASGRNPDLSVDRPSFHQKHS